MWKDLLHLTHVFVPLGSQKHAGTKCIVGQEALDLMMTVTLPSPEGKPLGLIYTDSRMFREDTIYAEVPTESALLRYLHSPEVEGVAFNLSWAEQSWEGEMDEEILKQTHVLPFSCTVWKTTLLRLVGFLQSPDPFADQGYSHTVLATEALCCDDMTVAAHHASAARDEGTPVHEHIFVEMETLLAFGLAKEAESLLSAFEGDHDHHEAEVFRARLLSLSGKVEKARNLLDELLAEPEIAPEAFRELGRIQMVRGEFDLAIESFEKSISQGQGGVASWLGRGVALRSQYESSGDQSHLNQAIECFYHVSGLQGHHAPVALSHAAGCYIAVGMFEQAETASRDSLSFRPSRDAQRSLILSLHGQGKVAEARNEYQESSMKVETGA